jgi:hypothetical protein
MIYKHYIDSNETDMLFTMLQSALPISRSNVG